MHHQTRTPPIVKLAFVLAVTLVPMLSAPLKHIDEEGYKSLLASQHGSVVLVNFWATWCVPCREELPELAVLAKKLKPQGVRLLVISADDVEDSEAARKFLVRAGITGESYLRTAKSDEAFINAIDSKWSGAVPALFLYDRNGRKVKSFIGESDLKVVEASVRALLGDASASRSNSAPPQKQPTKPVARAR